MTIQTNWAGNYTYGAARLHFPDTVPQLQKLVAGCRKIRALGTRHSFNGVADSQEDLVSLAKLNQVVSLDLETRTVTAEGGIRYGELCDFLRRNGCALHNMASLPHISVAGACATATHGSGDTNGILASAVSAVELVTASGDLIAFSREQNPREFDGLVVGLGGVGIVARLTLDLEPSFVMRQNVYVNLPLAEIEGHFNEVTSSAYSVSLFTDWQGERFTQAWLKSRINDSTGSTSAPEFFGGAAATEPRHPLDGMPAVNCTQQMGVPGPWTERLPHFRMEFTPSAGEELQSEYLIPRRFALPAVRSLFGIPDLVAPVLQISEIRTVAADRFWMSPCYQQPCVAIHFTWIKDWPAVREVLPIVEARLAPFQARPHWGKLFTMPPARVRSLYEKLPDFQLLLRSCDPVGKFRNRFLDRYVMGEQSEGQSPDQRG